MSRLIIVSNRVAPISEGGPAAGGLAVGVYDALKETGGMWFGWSGEVLASGQPQIKVEERGPATFATIPLMRRDYDQYYSGFSNATLWPAFHYRADLLQYDRRDFGGYCHVNTWLAQQLVPLLRADDVIWVHDYHLIPFAQALRAAGVKNGSASSCISRFPRRRCCWPCRHIANWSKRSAHSICLDSDESRPAGVLRLHRQRGEWHRRNSR